AATGLRRCGVQKGDKVLVWLPNGPDAVRAWFGANLVGACFAPLNIAYRGRLLEHAIEQSGATVMVLHAGLVERLQGIDVKQLKTLIVLGERPETLQWAGAVFGAEVLDAADDGAPDAQVERWDAQMLIFTSGTTGPSERVHRFEATTTSGLIGAMPAFLAKLPPSPNDKNNTLRFAVMPLSRQAIEVAQRHDFHYCSGFNMTELSVPLVTDVDVTEPGSCGRPRTGCECRIVDRNDIECPPGVTGELIVRNDLPWTTSQGYINQPEANARA